MACKESPGSRTEIQEAIKEQGEQIRKLKLEEQTDEVKNKVNVWLTRLLLNERTKIPWVSWIKENTRGYVLKCGRNFFVHTVYWSIWEWKSS